MSNAIYTHAKTAILSGGIDFASDPLKAALVTSAYTVNLDTDQYASAFAAHRIGTDASLSGDTLTPGSGVVTFSASITTFTGVPAATITYVVLYKSTGSDSTSPLIAYYDTVTGLPLTTSGGTDVNLQWSGSGVLSLS